MRRRQHPSIPAPLSRPPVTQSSPGDTARPSRSFSSAPQENKQTQLPTPHEERQQQMPRRTAFGCLCSSSLAHIPTWHRVEPPRPWRTAETGTTGADACAGRVRPSTGAGTSPPCPAVRPALAAAPRDLPCRMIPRPRQSPETACAMCLGTMRRAGDQWATNNGGSVGGWQLLTKHRCPIEKRRVTRHFSPKRPCLPRPTLAQLSTLQVNIRDMHAPGDPARSRSSSPTTAGGRRSDL
ncbi:hypothetical protein B0T11DRAFT_114772 [Plectosphaerella cucumerina]|uniref:Uncharacterized protein n=1 Tax=Plectosphaerella cucumerina TaxID=40658 RepID=A0A8K0TIX2_9PEZI|nr:hypothetical protein B0T11DRAFT_114772 [Plectosphaerella cucumerina]